MPIQRAKLTLNAARFPLVSTKGSRAVLIPGLDSAPRTPRQFVGNDSGVDYNTPQLLYCENVMPVTEGLRSTGWQLLVPETSQPDFENLIPLRNDKEEIVLYSPAKGKNYIYREAGLGWVSYPWATIWGGPPSTSSQNNLNTAKVTYAYVDGKTIICYSRLRSDSNNDMSLMFWDNILQTLQPAVIGVANMPFDPGTIDGVSSSNGYLLVYSGLSVAWARFNGTAFDFEPYANGNFTGSGNQIPEDIAGPINAIVSAAGGFIMFTPRNAVAATYNAQNLVSPWTFREVPGAGGVVDYESVALEGSLSAIYANTTAGMQRISLNSSEGVFPAVSDFITGRQIERYNGATKTLTQTSTAADLKVKVTNVGNRFICISYGEVANEYEFILVYDMTLERWGKLKLTHSDCFNYSFAPIGGGTQVIPAQHSIGLINKFGGIAVAIWTDRQGPGRDLGVALLGKVAISRGRNTQLNRVEVEGMESGTVHVIPSYDGATDYPAVYYPAVENTGRTFIAGGDVDCKAFSLLIEGAYDLSTVIIEAAPSGQL